MNKILIAIDDSKSAMRAVQYAAEHFSKARDIEFTLVHVLPNLPAIFWDEGHILNEAEKKERQKVVDKWLKDRRSKMERMLRQAGAVLTAQDVKKTAIVKKTIADAIDVAESILEAAKEAGASTIVLGRRGRGEGVHHLIGGVSNKVMHHAAGVAVIVVE